MVLRFDDIMLGSIEIFCHAAELGSFTETARKLGLTPAAVSRSVARLEARLKLALFVRSTRSMRLTEAGEAYLLHCRRALAQLEEAESEASGKALSPSGPIRLSLAQPYGQYRIMPLLAEFLRRYPDVSFALHLSNHNVDFTADTVDLVVRGRNPADSRLVARKLEDAPLVTVAAPAYLAARGSPQAPADLAGHDCIQFNLPSTGQPVPWVFGSGRSQAEIRTRGRVSCTDDLNGCVAMARLGCGVLQTYRFIVEADLKAGTLVEILHDHAGPSRPFSLVYPRDRHMPLRLRMLVDFLLAELKPRASSG